MLRHGEPLACCVSELGLVVQIILPLPLATFPFVGAATPTPAPYSSDGFGASSHDLRHLLDLICAHRWINVAIWSCLCNTEDRLSHQTLINFQSDLLNWRTRATSTFEDYDEDPSLAEPALSLASLPFPPKPQSFSSMDAALAAAIFHCYMGRTMVMASLATGGDEACETAAVLHLYHILRIVQGIDEEKSKQKFEYMPCNAVKMGFIPILFLGSQFSYDSRWLQFIIDKLMSIGQEGLFDGEAFANVLQPLALFQGHAKKLQACESVNEKLKSAFSLQSRVIAVLIPSPEEKRAVAYYVRALEPNPQSIARGKRKVVQIVGRARWESSADNTTSKSVSMEFFDPGHPINQTLGENCLYIQLASQEPIAQEWETLLGSDAMGPHGYFTHLATLRNSFTKEVESGLGAITGLHVP
jgi:hypothetical protein